MQVDARFDKESKKLTAIFITGVRCATVREYTRPRNARARAQDKIRIFYLPRRRVLLVRESDR